MSNLTKESRDVIQALLSMRLDSAESILTAFQEKVAKGDIADAISWYAYDAAKAAEQARWARNLLNWLQEETEKFEERIQIRYENTLKRVLGNSIQNSTCPSSRLGAQADFDGYRQQVLDYQTMMQIIASASEGSE